MISCDYLTGVHSEIPQFVPMDFVTVPEDTAVVPGESAMLPCSALYNNRQPDVYSWERNNALLSMRLTGHNK